MSNPNEKFRLYDFQVYRFPNFGFHIAGVNCKDGVELTVIFEDTQDSINNRHSYKVKLTKDSFKEQGYSLQDVLELLEKTFYEEIDCSIDYSEQRNPDRLILKIYENECFETLVFIEFQVNTFT